MTHLYRKNVEVTICGFVALVIKALWLPASASECSSGGSQQSCHEDTQQSMERSGAGANGHVGGAITEGDPQL